MVYGDIQKLSFKIKYEEDADFSFGFLSCFKPKLQNLTVCIVVNKEKFKSRRDLDLHRTIILIIIMVLYYRIVVYSSMFKFEGGRPCKCYLHNNITDDIYQSNEDISTLGEISTF